MLSSPLATWLLTYAYDYPAFLLAALGVGIAGGDLRQLYPAETTAEFAAELTALGEGEMTPQPVAARYGFHVIHLERRVAGEILPFEAVSERIAAYLGKRAGRTALALCRRPSGGGRYRRHQAGGTGARLKTPLRLRLAPKRSQHVRRSSSARASLPSRPPVRGTGRRLQPAAPASVTPLTPRENMHRN